MSLAKTPVESRSCDQFSGSEDRLVVVRFFHRHDKVDHVKALPMDRAGTEAVGRLGLVIHL